MMWKLHPKVSSARMVMTELWVAKIVTRYSVLADLSSVY
jgi:hypothetical protein